MDRLKRFWHDYARRYTGWYLLGFLFLLATNVLTVAIPGFVQEAVDALDAGRGADPAAAWSLAIVAAGAGIIVVRTLSRTLFFNPGRTIEFRLKGRMFDHLLDMPRAFFDRMRPGEIISRGTNDVNSVRALVGFASLQLFNVAFTLVLTLGKMAIANAALTFWCVLPLIAAALVMRVAVRAMFKLVAATQQQVATLSERILESYSGVGVLQAFGAEAGAKARFDQANDELLRLGVDLGKVSAWLLPIVSVVGNVCIVILLYVGGGMVVREQLTVGELAAFAVYINILVSGLTSLGWLVNSAQRGWISLGRVFEVVETPSNRPPAVATVPPPEDGGGHALTVEGLTFDYADVNPATAEAERRAEPALRDVTFQVAPGERLGLFGLTGAGKSTLLNVLARVYDPPPGTVRLGGVDVRDVPTADYWREVALVPQDAFLFSLSLRENIGLSAPLGGIDDARVAAAAEDAALTDDLAALPEGLETRVGERGIMLSGGQRQRTALARAFYRDARVLLLDDVMSAVDHATEKRLIDAVYRRAAGATLVIVSHRVSVLARADRILVLEDGRVVDEGTHDELVRRDGPYARAWTLQQAREAIEDDAQTREVAGA